MIGNQQLAQAQFGYCTQSHHPDDPLEHAKQRLAELKSKLSNVAKWQEEADRLERMIEAAK